MRISLVQMAIIEAAVDRNFKHLEKLLQEAILERPRYYCPSRNVEYRLCFRAIRRDC